MSRASSTVTRRCSTGASNRPASASRSTFDNAMPPLVGWITVGKRREQRARHRDCHVPHRSRGAPRRCGRPAPAPRSRFRRTRRSPAPAADLRPSAPPSARPARSRPAWRASSSSARSAKAFLSGATASSAARASSDRLSAPDLAGGERLRQVIGRVRDGAVLLRETLGRRAYSGVPRVRRRPPAIPDRASARSPTPPAAPDRPVRRVRSARRCRPPRRSGSRANAHLLRQRWHGLAAGARTLQHRQRKRRIDLLAADQVGGQLPRFDIAAGHGAIARPPAPHPGGSSPAASRDCG